jgi:serine/threonine protein kinase/WD40 repeat protein
MVRYAGGGLDTSDRSAIEHHVDGCADCLSLVTELARVESSDAAGGGLPEQRTWAHRYLVTGVVGAGGMGVVYSALDLHLNRKVAIKVLERFATPVGERPVDVSADPTTQSAQVSKPSTEVGFLRTRAERPRAPDAIAKTEQMALRFAREAALTARLQHPAIVTLYEWGVLESGAPYYVMRLVPGRSLHQALAEAGELDGRLRFLPNLIAAAEAVAFAHAERVVHRDLKPANVLCGEFGETVIIDWGLAKDLRQKEAEAEAPTLPAIDGAESQLARLNHTPPIATRAGAVLGTPAYMSPEQAKGASVDERTDVFALGAILYHLLLGRPPELYSEGGENKSARRPDARRASSSTPVLVGAPPELRAIAARATAHDPSARYPTAQAMAEDLRRFQTGQLVAAHVYTRGQLVRRFVGRNRVVLGVLGACLVALAAVGTVSISRVLRSRRDAEARQHEAEAARAQADEASVTITRTVEQLYLDEALASERAHPTEAMAWLKRLTLTPDNALEADLLFRGAGPTALATFRDPDGPIEALDFSPDGRTLAMGAYGWIRLWDLQGDPIETPPRRLTLEPPNEVDDVVSIGFSADSRFLLAQTTATLTVWNVATGASRQLLDDASAIRQAVISPDGASVATVDDGGVVTLWHSADGSHRSLGPGLADAAVAPAFAADGAVAWAGRDGRAVVAMATANGTESARTLATGPITSLCWSPDGQALATTGADGTSVWNPTTAERHLLGDRGSTWARYSKDGGVLITGPNPRTLFDAKEAYDVVGSHDYGEAVASREIISDDGVEVAGVSAPLSDLAGPTVNVFTGVDPDVCHSFYLVGHDSPAQAMSFSPDGTMLATGGNDKQVMIWRVPPPRCVLRSQEGSAIDAMDVSADGSEVALGQVSGAITVRQLKGTDAPPLELTGHAAGDDQMDYGVADVAFSPDGRLLASGGGADGRLLLWDLSSGAPRELTHVDGAVVNLAFSPDGGTLVSVDLLASGGSGEIRAWDIPSGGSRLLAQCPDSAVDLHFTADGTTLLAAEDNRVDAIPMAGGATRTLLTADAYIQVLSATGSGDQLATGVQSAIVLWDRQGDGTFKKGSTFDGDHGMIVGLAYLDGERLLASLDAGRALKVRDLKTGVADFEFASPLSESPRVTTRLAVLPGDDSILTADQDGELLEWNAAVSADPATVARSIAASTDDLAHVGGTPENGLLGN